GKEIEELEKRTGDSFAEGAVRMLKSDSYNHLFFNCEFSNKIWKMLLLKLKLIIYATDWNEIVKEIGKMKCNNSIDSLFKALVNGIKMHLTSLQVKDSVAIRRIEEDWDIKLKINKRQIHKECLAKGY
ncbi:hypothetical protein Tco_1159684, partial [Tanacetum coccineum]